MSERLLVIVGHKPSAILSKGEYVPRYYNPGNLFEEIHLLMAHGDQPNKDELTKTAGDAKLYLHNLPKPDFRWTLGWQTPFLRKWTAVGVDLAEDIKPALVRTHNDFMEGYLATRIKQELGIPFVTSLHGVWDRDHLDNVKEWIVKFAHYKFERMTLKNADAVIAVYAPIVRYAHKYGSKNVHLIYNMVSDQIKPKKHYRYGRPLRLITINRQVQNKNPENILRAIRDIDCHYVLVGDGTHHEKLKNLAREIGVEQKTEFIRALPNQDLVSMLPAFDVLVSHCDYWGISKSLIEASLAGLPIVINRHPEEHIPEHDGDWLWLVDQNTPEDYRAAISALAENEDLRAEYGRRAYEHAKQTFDPAKMEQKIADLYQKVMHKAGEIS